MSAFDDAEYEPSPWGPIAEEVERFEASNGAEPSQIVGEQWIILWTLGAKSGKVRKNALMRVEHGGAYLMVGSQGGAPTDPAWVSNARKAPDQVTVQDGPEPWDGVARELDGDEREVWWQRAVEAYPSYADYQQRTDRLIPVFLVERAG